MKFETQSLSDGHHWTPKHSGFFEEDMHLFSIWVPWGERLQATELQEYLVSKLMSARQSDPEETRATNAGTLYDENDFTVELDEERLFETLSSCNQMVLSENSQSLTEGAEVSVGVYKNGLLHLVSAGEFQVYYRESSSESFCHLVTTSHLAQVSTTAPQIPQELLGISDFLRPQSIQIRIPNLSQLLFVKSNQLISDSITGGKLNAIAQQMASQTDSVTLSLFEFT